MKNYVYVFVYNKKDIKTINRYLKWQKYLYINLTGSQPGVTPAYIQNKWKEKK